MYPLIFTEKFDKSFSKIKDKIIKEQIWNKIKELEERAPLGKKLKGNPFWSIHINKYRVIYEIRGIEIIVADVLERKYDYREI
ncbi:MAG: type II toxin-antitoxin system RelE/ParE family toxin [Nanoarchaeota archaeon]